MATKDLIKKMTSSQNVKPSQLLKVIEPERVKVDVISLSDKETATDRIEKEVEYMEKSEQEKKFSNLEQKCKELQDAMEVLLQDNNSMSKELESIKNDMGTFFNRLHKLEEKKPSFFKRLFKWA